MLKKLTWALILGAAACGSDGTGASLDADGGTHSPLTSMNCKPGSAAQSCYCTDGTKSGTQQCSTKGTLQECVCPPVKQNMPQKDVSAGGLCPDLQSQSGCVATPYLSEQLPASMLFVIDRSRSMVCNLPPLQASDACESNPAPVDSSMPTKWNIVRDSLTSAFGALPNGANIGLNYFSDDNMCGVDSAPAVELTTLDDTQRQSLTDSLNATIPGGETPIVGATILAYAHLHQEIHAPGNRFVVLITDGAESCAPDSIDQLLNTEVEKARDANIRTFVIGAPGSETARSLLSELAYRGGTSSKPNCKHDINGAPDQGDCHLDMTTSPDFAAALTAALGTVSTAAQGCEFPVPSAVNNASDVNVQYTPGSNGAAQCFGYDERDCDSEANGWQFTAGADGMPDMTKVKLCGAACDKIRQDPAARVDIILGCSGIVYL